MATAPEQDEPQPTATARVKAAISAPLEGKARMTTTLAVAAGLASFAAQPMGALAVALLVMVAAERRR